MLAKWVEHGEEVAKWVERAVTRGELAKWIEQGVTRGEESAKRRNNGVKRMEHGEGGAKRG